jgi:hypothetical protein
MQAYVTTLIVVYSLIPSLLALWLFFNIEAFILPMQSMCDDAYSRIFIDYFPYLCSKFIHTQQISI